MAARNSTVAMQLIRALALRLQLTQASPLTPLHISGIHNAMTDIPSRSFGSEKKWFCKTDEDLRSLFDASFPLPMQDSWNVFQPSPAICTRVISVLRTKVTTTDEWRRLPKSGNLLGTIGQPMSNLWDWTLYYRTHRTERDRAAADLIIIAFYYLLRVGEYTIKGQRNNTKQTVQFRMQDVTFFRHDHQGALRQLPRNASTQGIMTAHSATLKLDNQKNGWKGVCIHQEVNGDSYHCPVKALGRRYTHIRQHTTDLTNTFLSTFFLSNQQHDITDRDVSAALKLAGIALEYPSRRGIPIDRIDTHSLRSGGANALALNGYSDREIQKMGRWRSATFKEYIREELSCYSVGMSSKMQQQFNFVNIAGGVYTDVTTTLINTNYTHNTMTAEAA